MSIFTGCLLALVGCDKPANNQSKEKQTSANMEAKRLPPGKPEEYFPTDIGHRFDYKIELMESEETPAMNHEQVRWSKSRTETRGRYMLLGKKDRNDLHLILKVKSKSSKQGILEHPEGYELDIERDDIGVFYDSDKVFFAISKGDRYEVMLVTERSPNSPGSMRSGSGWGSYDAEPGCALRFFFFGERPMMSIGLSKENDSLTFVGPTEHKNRPALKFIREVTAREMEVGDKKGGLLDHGFEEEVIFVRGVGMVQLIQTVENTVTMKWTLVE